jgi:hypothetical protein
LKLGMRNSELGVLTELLEAANFASIL